MPPNPPPVSDGVDLSLNAFTRFSALAALYDAHTTRYLLDRCIGPGWSCLEVGAGGGSIAAWISDRVGQTGRVVATDVDTRFVETLGRTNLEIWHHDITRDPVPSSAFDLVHSRMVLIHLQERDEVLKGLAVALKPGGWLVCEEFDSVSYLPDPNGSPGEVSLRTLHAMGRVMEAEGVERRFGRLLYGKFRRLGLAHIGAEARLFMLTPGSPGVELLRASCDMRRKAMIGAGYVSAEEFDEDLARMQHPEFLMPSPVLWTAWGQRL